MAEYRICLLICMEQHFIEKPIYSRRADSHFLAKQELISW